MRRNVRVAHIGKFAPDSANGVYAAVAGLVTHLPAEGLEVQVWHLSGSATGITEQDERGVHVVRLPRHAQNVRNAVALPKASWQHLQRLARSVDVLHFHSVYQGHNVSLARLGVPYIVSPHSGYTERVTRGRHSIGKAAWRSLWERNYVRGAASLHAVSRGEAHELEGHALAHRVVYIPNGLDEQWLNESAGPVPNDGPWLFLGRLAIDQKGLDVLLEGYAKAQKKAELPSLQLVGPDFRGSVKRLRKMISALGLNSCVEVLPPVFGDEKLSLLRAAGAVLHPSRWDGMPFTVLEAMALGRPVVVTPSTNLSAEVQRSDAGIVVTESSDGIAEGLACLATSSSSWRRDAGMRARDLVREDFTWEQAARQMAALYREVAA